MMGVDFGRLRGRVQVMIDGIIALLANFVVAAVIVPAFVWTRLKPALP